MRELASKVNGCLCMGASHTLRGDKSELPGRPSSPRKEHCCNKDHLNAITNPAHMRSDKDVVHAASDPRCSPSAGRSLGRDIDNDVLIHGTADVGSEGSAVSPPGQAHVSQDEMR